MKTIAEREKKILTVEREEKEEKKENKKPKKENWNFFRKWDKDFRFTRNVIKHSDID